MKAGCDDPAVAGQLLVAVCLDHNTLNLGNNIQGSFFLRVTVWGQCSCMWPVKGSIFYRLWLFLWVIYAHSRCLVSWCLLYLFITLSQSPRLFLFVCAAPIMAPITRAYTNSLCQYPFPYLNLIPSFTFTLVPTTHFSQLFFPNSVFFSPLLLDLIYQLSSSPHSSPSHSHPFTLFEPIIRDH